MSELEDAWAVALANAEARALAEGRPDFSDYLALRTANDFLRTVGTDWLLTAFTNFAGEANRAGASIKLSREDAHRFKVGNTTIVGPQLNLENGIRKLTIEAGWPRTPRDGFIRGGGLACANIKHLGMKSSHEELRLILDPNGIPKWIVPESDDGFREVHESDARRHIAILLHTQLNRP
ncbi:MAG TPA: hypothetical protein VJU86_23550 [Pyrinomonadaceae bacterium]|nr:hypothetical protein [Pyrinomonadaceae bacterium]